MKLIVFLALLVFFCAACNEQSQTGGPPATVDALPAAAPVVVLLPSASGTDERGNDKVEIDASNTRDGYIMARYLGDSPANVKALVTGPSQNTYTYTLNSSGSYEVFPLSDGDGPYAVGVYKNIDGNKYSAEFATELEVALADPFAPFLRPNQFVNFNESSLAVRKAAELAAGAETELDKVGEIYAYVVATFTYDHQLAETVQSGYLPNLDEVWAKKSGICFDYAAVMTAMLRSQGIPAKLVIGYAGEVYHAWISVFIEDIGWIDNIIYFDGANWALMDPTFASGGASSNIMEFIGDNANYAAQYLY